MGGRSSTCLRLVIYLRCGVSQMSKMWAAGKGHHPAPTSPPSPARSTLCAGRFPTIHTQMRDSSFCFICVPFTFQVLPSVLFISSFGQSFPLAFPLTFPPVLHTLHFLVLSCPPFSLLVPFVFLLSLLSAPFSSLSFPCFPHRLLFCLFHLLLCLSTCSLLPPEHPHVLLTASQNPSRIPASPKLLETKSDRHERQRFTHTPDVSCAFPLNCSPLTQRTWCLGSADFLPQNKTSTFGAP